MSRLFVFGDSFQSHNSNYIKRLANGREVIIKAVYGSSIFFTLEELIKSRNEIKETDSVLIGITAPYRKYFDNKHIIPDTNYQFNDDTRHSRNFIKQFASACRDYYKYLFNPITDLLQATSAYNTIVDYVIPSLETSKVSIISNFSIHHLFRYNIHDDRYKHLLSSKFTHPMMGIHIFTEDWMLKNGIDKKVWYKEHMKNHNHWLDLEGFEDDFFEYFSETFNAISC